MIVLSAALWAAGAAGSVCREGGVEADLIRIWDISGDFMHLAEIEAYDAVGVNVLKGVHPEVSSEDLRWGGPASLLTDGDTNAFRFWHTAGGSNEKVDIRFPRPSCIHGVRVYGRAGGEDAVLQRQNDIRVELRRDSDIAAFYSLDLSKPPHSGAAGKVPDDREDVPDFAPERLHIVFSTECDAYFDWQSVGLFHSIKKVYAGGEMPFVTRLSACRHDDRVLRTIHDPGWEGYHPRFSTHVHPPYNSNHCPDGAAADVCNPRDTYSAYNKPGSVTHWLEHVGTSAEYVAFLDADQILRNPINPEWLGAKEGKVVSAYYGYLHGTKDSVHMGVKSRMIAEGRNRSEFQKAGGFFIFHTSDLKKVAPLWLRYTQAVRADPDSWANTGDLFNCRGAPAGCQGRECKCP
eukprot:Hpha_TRINITY_DN15534_c0_g9::TRINITY_DN15534_c0_g9_i1::g.106551::m.106551/K20781/SGT1; peptidyl serine alpha-galactosyltransferase